MAQHDRYTESDRYPEIFRTSRARVAKQFGPNLNGTSLRILSFGCSTGEEMKSLRAYFPAAEIMDCDVDISEAAAAGLEVFLSSPESVVAAAPFDIVFAMSVLCYSSPGVPLPDVFSFAEFEMHARSIHRALKPGGLFCLYNASYQFEELPFASEYRPVRSRLIIENGFVPKWHSSGIQISKRRPAQKSKSYPPIVLRPDFAGSFRDCIFEKSRGDAIDVDIPKLGILDRLRQLATTP